ncbi:stage V sporulation protein AC [Alteribacillus iranensis]|uniref:Stage V sporulation protein AC n=1 Tax=Alteribacillus iranensis TaxID=930128 RepID=A0A1I1ZLZ5_9BACI|nr:stage V sporulation protein AC [Alteribacillus iranensis]SFE32709.1 stage V sporulation protein AC [Alteribacillus iranensis]
MKKNQQQTNEQKIYQDYAAKKEPKPPILLNCLKAFIIGGLVCTFGQLIQDFFLYNFDFNEQTAGDPTIAVLILISVLLTGFGVYDKLAQFAGAGVAVPVTGFANSMSSAAIEYRTEGYVLGVGGNMFKLAGPVIVYGTTSAFLIALIKTLWMQWGG